MMLLATAKTPTGNIVELHEEEGHYLTRRYVLECTIEISEAQAQDWYRTALLRGRAQGAVPAEGEGVMNSCTCPDCGAGIDAPQ